MSDVSSDQRRRYLAVWFPFLSAHRLKRQAGRSRVWDEAPICFIEKLYSARRITAVNGAAIRLGLAPGLTLVDARARVPGLVAMRIDRDADAAWLERIADFCDRYTPMVALDAPDGVVLDITGCAHLFGGEHAMRNDILSRLSRATSKACAAIAGTPQAAHALARFNPPGSIVPPGIEMSAVAPLPVAALDAGPETVTALRRAGLKTIGDLAALPRTSLAARFDADTLKRLARVLGEENTGITPRRPLPPCSAERHFAEPITRTEDALRTLERLTFRVAQSLETRGEGGQGFEARFFRADGAVTRLSVETSQPVRTVETVVRLFQERIETLNNPLDPGYGYDLIRLSVVTSAPYQAVRRSLDGREAEDEDVSALVDRLSVRLGKTAVVRFTRVDTHNPERAVQAVHAGKAVAADAGTWPTLDIDARPRRPIFLFERPEPIEALAEIPDGPPLKFRWRSVLHKIVRAEGPERIAPEWWRSDDAHTTRDYFCVEDIKGQRFWVFRDGLYYDERRHPRWFLHGLFA